MWLHVKTHFYFCLGCYAQPAEERDIGTHHSTSTLDPVKECRDR